jgi:carbon storage regulator
MLVLTRHEQEEIVIAGKIRIKVLGIQEGRIRLDVSAPREAPVVRKEVRDRQAGPAAVVPRP